MSDPVYMDFEEPADPSARKSPKPRKPRTAKKPEPEAPKGVPKLPSRDVEVFTGDEIKRGVSERSRAAANLKVDGYSYAEIADMLEFETPQDAKRAVEGVLAAIHGPGDYESLRLMAAARLEKQIQRSTAMASATHLVLPDGTEVANTEQLRWHQAAATDIMNWAIVTGAKAPTKIEITPDEAALERLVDSFVLRAGHEDILDADVLELEVLPAITDGEDDEYDPLE